MSVWRSRVQPAIEFCRRISTVPIVERWLLRFTMNHPYRGVLPKIIANPGQYPRPSARRATRNGVNYELDVSDLVDWYLFWGFSDPSIERLLALARPGMVYVDVGANVGNAALQIANIVGPSGRVVAFEPDPVNYRRLSRNIVLNGDKVEHRQIGLSDRAGAGSIETPDAANRSSNRIGTDGPRIQLSTLDHETAAFDRLDLVSIDVEGHEIHVIKGGIETLRRLKPVLFVECIDRQLRHSGGSARQLVDLIKSTGYVVRGPDGAELNAQDVDGCDYDITCVPL